MNNYYQILGVTSSTTLDQIKKAYRKKAKLLHPDLNKDVDADEKFILLNEAYEYLLRTTGSSSNRFKRAQEQAKRQAAYQQEWEQKEKERVRARAQQYAKMKYEAYIKSDIYKTTEALNLVVDFFVTLLVLLFVIGLPILTYIEHGSIALILSAIIIIPTSPLWFRFLVNVFGNIHIKSLFIRKESTVRSKMFSLMLLFIFNVIIFFRIALSTLIEVSWIIGLYALAFAIGFLLSSYSKRRFKKYLMRFNFAPGAVSALFLINFLISTNFHKETYSYTYNAYSSPVFTSIQLNDNAYQQYKGMRMFISKESILGKSCIQYSLKDGILGFKVVKHRELLYNFPSKTE